MKDYYGAGALVPEPPADDDAHTKDHPDGNCARDAEGRPLDVPLDVERQRLEKGGE